MKFAKRTNATTQYSSKAPQTLESKSNNIWKTKQNKSKTTGFCWEQLLLLFLISTYITHNYFAKCKLLLLFCLIFDIIKSLLPSSSGPGHWPLTPATWVRISLGVPMQKKKSLNDFSFSLQWNSLTEVFGQIC